MCNHWASQRDSWVLPLHYMVRGFTHSFLPCTWRRYGRSGHRGMLWSLVWYLLRTPCTHYSMVRGINPWTQTPVDSWGWCPLPCTLFRHGAPPHNLVGCAVTPQEVSILGLFPLLLGWLGRQRGWTQDRCISQVEGQDWGTRSGIYQRFSLSTPRSLSGVDGTPWLQHIQDCPGAWGERGVVIPLLWHQPMQRSTWLIWRLLVWSRPISQGSKRRSFVDQYWHYNMIYVRLIYLCIRHLYLLPYPSPYVLHLFIGGRDLVRVFSVSRTRGDLTQSYSCTSYLMVLQSIIKSTAYLFLYDCPYNNSATKLNSPIQIWCGILKDVVTPTA